MKNNVEKEIKNLEKQIRNLISLREEKISKSTFRILNIFKRENKTEKEIEKLGGKTIYITAKAPEFFAKYGYEYLDEKDVPDIFVCLDCKQLNITCNPKFMIKKLNV